jgi:hypothetical protein
MGVVPFGGAPTGPHAVRENRGAGAACSMPLGRTNVERAFRCSLCAASAQVSTGVTHASVPAKISLHSSRDLRLLLHVEADDALAAVQQVDVLGRHGQPAGPADTHHVGAEVGQNHRRMRSRADATEFDHFHTDQGFAVRHPLETNAT